jgi:pilus assembly protein CpaE
MPTRTVLFVDDEEHIRKVISTYLDRRGYEVVTAANGEEALRIIAERTPDIVVTDVSMPKMDGFELTRRLRAHPRTASVPVIILSALKQEERILAGYQAGADDYVPKPVELAVLAAKIEAALRHARPVATEAQAARGKVVTLLHAKGGVGTTTIAVNLAVAANEDALERSTLIDASAPLGDAAVLLDLHPRRNLADIVLDAGRVDPEVLRGIMAEHASGLSLIASPTSPLDAERITGAMVKATIEAARDSAAHIFVDTGAAFDPLTIAAIDSADTLCVVTNAHLSSILATKQYLTVLDRMEFQEERRVIFVARTTPSGIDDAAIWKALGVSAGQVVPYSELFPTAADEGRPLVQSRPDSAAATAIQGLARMLSTR